MARQSALRIVSPILVNHPLQALQLIGGCRRQLQLTTKIASHPNHATQSPADYEEGETASCLD